MGYDANGQWVADQQSTQPQASDFDTQFGQYIPLDLLGSRGRIQAQRDTQAAQQNQGYWNSLQAPTQAGLMQAGAPGRDAQMQALQQMRQWQSGGLTGTDRGTLEASRSRDAQAAGATARGISQQAQARGVGGSGLDYAAQMGAQQQGQQQASDQEASAMQGAQQRGLAATQASSQMGSQLRTQDTGALQQAYEDAANRAAGATGQYGTDMSARQAGRTRQQQSDTSLVGAVAGLF